MSLVAAVVLAAAVAPASFQTLASKTGPSEFVVLVPEGAGRPPTLRFGRPLNRQRPKTASRYSVRKIETKE